MQPHFIVGTSLPHYKPGLPRMIAAIIMCRIFDHDFKLVVMDAKQNKSGDLCRISFSPVSSSIRLS